ncbi:response regulator [Calycomorphotria hydatis]|uniref:Response regulator rcp1 n=1 Tax=Calycomorphotria hydatis TaxID=2528027 RepID=A0A517TAB0_9PLAN|nr:response regulator [Calycomorphotria hydatis]QDT65307.1 Response regulator rcp1 [Calycomorphotria hydatis]
MTTLTQEKTVGRPMEILLVEDSLTAARMTMGVLRAGDFQHRMTWITNGEEAVEFLLREGKFVHAPHPDLILLDLGLPKKDGREVLREIRHEESLKETPVVVLTASTSEEDRLITEKLHVESYLTKPVNLPKFLNLVTELSEFWRTDMILPTAPPK